MKKSQFKFVNTIFFASSLFIAIGCQSQVEKAELNKFKAAAQIQEQNKEIVREVINAIDSGDLTSLEIFYLMTLPFTLLVRFNPGGRRLYSKPGIHILLLFRIGSTKLKSW